MKPIRAWVLEIDMAVGSNLSNREFEALAQIISKNPEIEAKRLMISGKAVVLKEVKRFLKKSSIPPKP